MNYCKTCGGPRWRDSEKYASGIMGRRWQRWETVDGCRLCWLHLPALPRRQPIEWRGLTDDANSTANSPATSTWLPPGAREGVRLPDQTLQSWLEDADYFDDFMLFCDTAPADVAGPTTS